MAYTIRGRRVAFDNLLYATAASKEITAIGTSGAVSGPSEALAKETFVAGTAAVRTTDCLDHIITMSGGVTSVYTSETMVNTN